MKCILVDKNLITSLNEQIVNNVNNVSRMDSDNIPTPHVPQIIKIEVLENTQYVIDLNSFIDLPEISIDFLFNISGVNAHIIGLYSLQGTSKLTTKIRAIHNVENTSCLVDIKGSLYDKSFSNHYGEIYIGPNAQKTESFLNDHTLLLSPESRTISMPNLRIFNNDVKASHGASIGPVDEEKLYYLQSRGIEKNDAINIIVSGFFEPTFNDITDQSMANVLRQKLLTSQYKTL